MLFYCSKGDGGEHVSREDNLIPITERSEKEQRKMRSKGGRKSGETRRRKKTIKSILSAMMTMRIADIQDEGIRSTFMKAAGSENGNVTIAEAIAGGMLAQSIRGDSRMVSVLLKLLGEDPELKIKQKEHRLKVKQAQKEEAVTEYKDDGLEKALHDSVGKVWEDEETE